MRQKSVNKIHIFILLNLIVIDIWIISSIFTPKPNVLGVSSASCPTNCVNLINQMTSGGTATAKESFIPLGSGSNQSGDWTDVPGAQAYIDSSLYSKIKKVTFEATIEVPSGAQKSYVRLYNATDKHPVWQSEVASERSDAHLLVSPAITLDSGNILYKVQMKSQLSAKIILTQSRIHILTY